MFLLYPTIDCLIYVCNKSIECSGIKNAFSLALLTFHVSFLGIIFLLHRKLWCLLALLNSPGPSLQLMGSQFCSLQNSPKAVGQYTAVQRDFSYLSSLFQFPKVHTSKPSAHCPVFPNKKHLKLKTENGLYMMVLSWCLLTWEYSGYCLLPLDLDFQKSWPVNKLFLDEVSRAESQVCHCCQPQSTNCLRWLQAQVEILKGCS